MPGMPPVEEVGVEEARLREAIRKEILAVLGESQATRDEETLAIMYASQRALWQQIAGPATSQRTYSSQEKEQSFDSWCRWINSIEALRWSRLYVIDVVLLLDSGNNIKGSPD